MLNTIFFVESTDLATVSGDRSFIISRVGIIFWLHRIPTHSQTW